LDHAANYKSVSGLASIIPDFQAHCIAISQIFGWMSYVANTGVRGQDGAAGEYLQSGPVIGVKVADDHHHRAAAGQLDGGLQQILGGLGILEGVEDQRLASQVDQPGIQKTRPQIGGYGGILAFGQRMEGEMKGFVAIWVYRITSLLDQSDQ
jgi:hypothetical protein